MKNYKDFVLVGILLVMAWFSLAFVNVGYLQILLQKNTTPKETEFCSETTSGLKFCTDSQKVTRNSGNSVILNFSLTNTSEKDIDVRTNRDMTKYDIKVIDGAGELILTKLEKKVRTNLVLSSDDQRDFINSLVTNNRSETLRPNQILNERIVLSDIYDFTSLGNYYVEVIRKRAQFQFVPLGCKERVKSV